MKLSFPNVFGYTVKVVNTCAHKKIARHLCRQLDGPLTFASMNQDQVYQILREKLKRLSQ